MIVGIETGGTKVICAAAPSDDPQRIVDTERIETTTPEQTLARIRAFLDRSASAGGLEGVGLASFGPLEVDSTSAHYGWITSTPKPGWRDTDLVGGLGLPARGPYRVVTDVTGAAVGEYRSGSGKQVRSLAYVTVGTGIGVGLAAGGGPFLPGGHPELGHLLVRRHPADTYPGLCPFHGDCLEGLASGPALAARWGTSAENLGSLRARAVDLESFYAAQLLAAVTYTVAPGRIVVGGGVMKIPGLFDAVRQRLAELVGEALDRHPLTDPSGSYLVPPALGDYSGVRGALFLAADAAAPSVMAAG